MQTKLMKGSSIGSISDKQNLFQLKNQRNGFVVATKQSQSETKSFNMLPISLKTPFQSHQNQTQSCEQSHPPLLIITANKSTKQIKKEPKKYTTIQNEKNQNIQPINQIQVVNRRASDKSIKSNIQKHKEKVINSQDYHQQTVGGLLKFDKELHSHQLVTTPLKSGNKVNFAFNRPESCIFSKPITFQTLFYNSNQTLECQKISRFICSEFKIYINKEGVKQELGTLKSNFSGSIYNLYIKQSNQIYCSILFGKSTQNTRRCEIYINHNLQKNGDNQHNEKNEYGSQQCVQSLQDKYQFSKESCISKYISKVPQYSSAQKCYYLNFHTKNLLSSIKNTIFVNKRQKQVLKFYKNTSQTYNVIFQQPFSWILVYAYCLATTDFKFATQ